MIDITHYMSRYKKSSLAKRYSYRSDVDIFKRCASEQCIIENIDLNKEKLIYTDNSIKTYFQKYESDMCFLSEAVFKTYPTEKLSKFVVKLLTNEFKEFGDKCLFTIDLDSPKEKLVYNTTEKAIYEYDNYDKQINDINMFFNCSGEYIEGNVAGNIVYIFTLNHSSAPIKFDAQLIEKLIDAGQKYGYDYVTYSITKLPPGIQYEIMFESKYQKNDIEIADKLYHVAPYSLKDKILKYGLSPKSNSINNGTKLNHSDRVYLYNGYDEDKIMRFLYANGKESKHFNKLYKNILAEKHFALFEINKSKISHITFFRDNMYSTKDKNKPIAIYTYDNIPPIAINFIKEIKL